MVAGWSTQQQKSSHLRLCCWHPNYPTQHICVQFCKTFLLFWRKRAMKKSSWLREVRQDGDTDPYQLLKATKRHIQHLSTVASQEEPRHEESLRVGVTSLSWVIAMDAGHGAPERGTPWECEQKLQLLCFEVCSKYNHLPRRRSGTGTCTLLTECCNSISQKCLCLSFCREQTGLEALRVQPFMLLSVTNPDEY